MCRTVPPPEGMGQARMAVVAGSNRTSMFFVSLPVSQYHTAPFGATAMAYGWLSAPPGDGNSSTFAVRGFNRPRVPRA